MGKTIREEPLYFNLRERRGTLFIIFIALAVTVGPYAWHYYSTKKESKPQDYSAQIAALESLQKDTSFKNETAYDQRPYQSYNASNQYISQKENMQAALFSFDPNTLSVEGWKNLGVKEKTALSIQKYISKGGKFRKPEDIKKIWGISPEKAAQLIPYAQIAVQTNNYPETYSSTFKEEYPRYEKKKTEFININGADTIAFASLPGIGPGYARRITKFRDRLGGFYSVTQVAETFGLPDSTYQKILPYLNADPAAVKKINVNSVTEEVLKEHPYIRWQLAKIIVAYRTQHGDFKKIEDLRNIMTITPEVYEKISHYLVTD